MTKAVRKYHRKAAKKSQGAWQERLVQITALSQMKGWAISYSPANSALLRSAKI